MSERFTDYYVFPKLSIEGDAFSTDETDTPEYLDAEKIFTALKEVKAIRITGDSGTGKTSLVKHLYVNSAEMGYIPLLVEKHILESGKLLVYTTRERNDNLEEIVKNKLQKTETCTLGIQLTYKETRDKLVENVGGLLKRAMLIYRLSSKHLIISCNTKRSYLPLHPVICFSTSSTL